jgi:hypothetical protein
MTKLEAERPGWREALAEAAKQFRFYEQEHRTKALAAMTTGPTHAAIEKAKTNKQFAEMCEAALHPSVAEGREDNISDAAASPFDHNKQE